MKEYEYPPTDKLLIVDEAGIHVNSPEIAEKLEKKSISASMITGLNNCAARWLADTFVIRDLVEEEPDNAARRGSLFHKVMEDFFALSPEERTTAAVKDLAQQTLYSDEFVDLSKNVDVIKWLRDAINNYYSMGGSPQKVNVAEIVMEEGQDPKKGLEIFIKGQIGNAKRETLGFIDRLVMSANEPDTLIIEDWKGLSLDTMLPTPHGWTTMGDVQVGDQLLGAQGQTTTVLNKSDIHHRPCYEITFSNQETVVCDNVHLWTFDRYWNFSNPEQIVAEHDITIDTEELFSIWQSIKDDQKNSHLRIKNTQSLQGTKVFSSNDEITDFVNTLVSECYHENPFSKDTLNTLVLALRSTDNERLFMLRSLMEHGGTVENYFDSGIYVFEDLTPDYILGSIFAELLSTFGMNYSYEDDGSISFLSAHFYPFHKNDNNNFSDIDYSMDSFENTYFTYITDVKPVESVPTQCVKVDADDSLYLFSLHMIPTHNTGAKIKHWKKHTKSDEGWAEQRQQLIYKILLEQKGFNISGARLIYPVAQGIEKVDVHDQDLIDQVIQDVEDTDKALDVMIKNNTFEYTKSFLCHWCPLVAICPAMPYINKKSEKLRKAFESQPPSEVLLKAIEIQ